MRPLALLLILCACDPYRRTPLEQAAMGLPSCMAEGALFAIPPELCPEFRRIYGLVVAEVGRPKGVWRIMASDPPEPFRAGNKTIQVWGKTYCANRRIVVAEHPGGWCASALAHELVHAVDCPEENPNHVGWDAKDGLNDAIVRIQQECQWEEVP